MNLLNSFDQLMMGAVNQWVGRSAAFDDAVRILTDWNFFRAAWLGCFLLWAWFADRDEHSRLKMIAGIGAIVCATGLSKLLQVLLHFHARPFAVAADLGYNVPHNVFARWGDGNCFPSDTATVYFAVAAVIFSVSRAWGWAAFVWVAAVIALPRVYLLYHWPSDIIAGCALGVAMVALFQGNRHAFKLCEKLVRFERQQAALFYPILFVVLYQIVDSFHALEFGAQQFRTVARLLIA